MWTLLKHFNIRGLSLGDMKIISISRITLKIRITITDPDILVLKEYTKVTPIITRSQCIEVGEQEQLTAWITPLFTWVNLLESIQPLIWGNMIKHLNLTTTLPHLKIKNKTKSNSFLQNLLTRKNKLQAPYLLCNQHLFN